MQDIAVVGRSKIGSTLSNKVRLSTTTITPDIAEVLCEDQRLRTDQHNEIHRVKIAHHTLHDIHKRSQSLNSQHSQALSTQSTNDTSSSSESNYGPRLTRDNSYLSSIPTSPEDELSGSLTSIAAVRRNHDNSVVDAPVSATRTKQENDNAIAWEIIQLSKEDVESSPVPDISTGRQNSASSSDTRQNRNKPLPIPKELLNSTSSATSPSAAHTTRSTLPALSVSTAANQSTAGTPASGSPASQTKTDSSEATRQARSKSAMGRYSSDLRMKHNSKAKNPMERKDALSDTFKVSLTGSYRLSRSPSPVHDSQRKHAKEANPSTRLKSTSRPSSPFHFRNGNSWLSGTKFEYLQERHLKAPQPLWQSDPLQPLSSASSSSSNGSSGPESKAAKPTSASAMPNFSRTLRNDQGKRASHTPDAKEIKSLRPPPHRHRSKSMDVLQMFKSSAVIDDLKRLSEAKHVDSIAVGRTSVNEVQVPSAVRSSIDGHHDRSVLSRLLTRKPSKATLQHTSSQTKEAPPKLPSKDAIQKVRPEGREGALSRLTGSLLGKKSSSSIKGQSHASTRNIHAAPTHRRQQSLDSQKKIEAVRPTMNPSRMTGLNLLLDRSPHTSPSSRLQKDSATLRAAPSSPSRPVVRAKSVTNLVDTRPAPLQSDKSEEENHSRRTASATHSRNQSSDNDDFYSITSMTPSTSQQATLPHSKSGLESNRISPSSSKRVSQSRKSSPPSAYREWAPERKPTMTKSESDPLLLQIADKKQSRSVARANTLASERVPVLPSRDLTASDTKEEPLAGTTLPPSIAPKSLEHRKDFHKPFLSIDVNASALDIPARPNSAMELTKDGAFQHQRRHSQATLSIADDMEFLQALERVRKVNQDRIKRQDEDDNRVSQMARMGMATVNRRAKGREQDRGRQSVDRPRLRHSKRSSSAHERSNSLPSTQSDPVERPSALELGVGKASGKMQDGAFINDDDWKKEVKALFIIREMVLTERSYARHLEALLQSVRALYPAVKKPTGASLARQSISVPAHINTMRRLLPQLIALSRGLADRIDADPTAAGVGTAFRLVGGQMEATFIAWSSVVTDIMSALRVSEKTNSKTKDRIGLITLSSFERNVTDEHGRIDGLKTLPSSPMTALTPSLAVPMEIPLVSSPISESIPNVDKPAPLSFRRRSTLSGLSPSFTASIRSKAISSISNDPTRKKSGDVDTQNGSGAMEGVVTTSVPKPTIPKTKTRSDSMSLPAKSRPLLSVSPSGNSASTPITGSLESFSSKRLSAMDVVIMPTQRLLRYLLLLKDLNSNTPPQSLSHIRLQRCLDSLAVIASRCDKASSSR
jgi:hypothetical protein